jgi:UDP-N-acetylmuramyl pentapeptide phosphotransferase/UDP-N-acetylglucosamine-1-phosphate transferase
MRYCVVGHEGSRSTDAMLTDEPMSGDSIDLWAASFTTVVLAAAVSVALILLLHPLLRRYALARPNARSSHREPTPQGGGIAVIAATVIATYAVIYLVAPGVAIGESLMPIFAGTLWMAVVGMTDDIHPLAVGPRLLLQATIIASVIYAIPDDLRVLPPSPLWLERLLLVLGGLWFVNLANFMDGVDWMTVAEVIPLVAGLVALAQLDALPTYGLIVALALGGAMLGFAYFNRPVAKLFLGDVGSLPIGLLLAWLLFLVAASGHLVAAILLPLYYLADATVTLLWRLARGEPIWRAHRAHFYQIATDRGLTVTDVVARVFAANIGLAALAIASVVVPGKAADVVLLSLGILLVAGLLLIFARGKK